MENAYVYILKSLKNDSYYIGSTKNPDNRVEDHNLGRSTYTRNNRPYVLKFIQSYGSLKEARQIEYKLKKHSSRIIIEKIIKDGTIKLKV